MFGLRSLPEAAVRLRIRGGSAAGMVPAKPVAVTAAKTVGSIRGLYQRTASDNPPLMNRFLIIGLIALTARCQRSVSGSAKPMRLTVGDINEISLARPADRTIQLTGTSDNSEIVDVSPKQTAAGEPSTASDRVAFLIKGVTAGTARVMFTEKRADESGAGHVRKTYVVQVRSN